MALTVREAMGLGGLRRGEVLAGSSGLDRAITWIKVLESPETINWLAEGELLLTVAFAIKDDQAAQRNLMRDLAAAGSSGLVIKPERYPARDPRRDARPGGRIRHPPDPHSPGRLLHRDHGPDPGTDHQRPERPTAALN